MQEQEANGSSGWHKWSIAYTSSGQRRYNQPFSGSNYAPHYEQGDVVGVGYRPRTGTVFFTRNGKKLDDVAHGLKTQNFFPTVGANGPCNIQVNFGQMGFVFIEANVKKWGLAPMTGSLAPPPPYGSEQGSILIESGRDGIREGQGYFSHGRTMSNQARLGRPPTSPGPQRSPTDISLAQLNLMDSREEDNAGEGTSIAASTQTIPQDLGISVPPSDGPPPEYSSPDEEEDHDARTPRASEASESRPLLDSDPPIPSYEAAIGDIEAGEARNIGGEDDARS